MFWIKPVLQSHSSLHELTWYSMPNYSLSKTILKSRYYSRKYMAQSWNDNKIQVHHNPVICCSTSRTCTYTSLPCILLTTPYKGHPFPIIVHAAPNLPTLTAFRPHSLHNTINTILFSAYTHMHNYCWLGWVNPAWGSYSCFCTSCCPELARWSRLGG